ncbi:unnamed protein product, partial [Protopolystoma xenopodis]
MARLTDNAYYNASKGPWECTKSTINASFAGSTALQLACQKGHLACIDLLLAHGASWRPRDAEGNQAVHTAAQGGSVEALRCLVTRLPYYYRQQRRLQRVSHRRTCQRHVQSRQ